MNNFKNGDFVTCKKVGMYGVTNEYSFNVVIDSDMYDIRVCTIGGENIHNIHYELPLRYTSFWVSADDFVLITPEEWKEKRKEWNRRGLDINIHYEFDEIVDFYRNINNRNESHFTENLFVTDKQYKFTERQKERAISTACYLYDKYEIDFDRHRGVAKEWERYSSDMGKAKLAAFLSQHPDWDDEAMAIIKRVEIKREFSEEGVINFCNWVRSKLDAYLEKHEVRRNGMSYDEAYDAHRNIEYILRYMRGIRDYHHSVRVDGMTYEDWVREKERLNDIRNLIEENSSFCYNSHYDAKRVPRDIEEKFESARQFLTVLQSIKSDRLTAKDAEKVNEIAKPFNRISPKGKLVTLGAREGMCWSKIVLRFFDNFGITKIVENEKESFTDTNGDVHVQIRKKGWNPQYTDFCDSIKETVLKRTFVFSVNMIDYLTSSLGANWGSCHTIDYLNKRGVSDTHSGMYRSGTLSYMGDGVTVVGYFIKGDYKGKDYCLEDKISRCMFHIGNNKICQGRTYPDSRSLGKESQTAQLFRQYVEEIFDYILKANGVDKVEWEFKRGTNICGGHVEYEGTGYDDALEYDDCGMIFLKGKASHDTIIIGSSPICPVCGCEHGESGHMTCCRDM